jgi:hypothetical protein
MLTSTTLNARPPRTLQDSARDPFDWIEHHRSPRHWAEPLITVMAVVFALAIAAPAVWHAVAAAMQGG